MTDKLCIYCQTLKSISVFSLEHIFPDSLGGSLCNDLFKTRDVCGRCNSIMGAFVDGAFIRNWFRNNDEALAARQYLDLNASNSILPLAYMGILKSLPLREEQVCEMWLGACGERFYHIHEKDDPRWDTFVGGNPMARKNDPGLVYFFNTSDNGQWISLALRSMRNHFKRARRYASNVGIEAGDDPSSPFLHPIDKVAQEELDLIRALGNDTHAHSVQIQQGFEQRFLAKMALGLGYNILGSGFFGTSYARYLLAALWEKNFAARAILPVRGSGFLKVQNAQLNEIIGWPGAYTIMLHAFHDCFALSFQLPSGQSMMHIVISDSPGLWQTTSLENYRHGVVFLVAPQCGKFVGPISLPEYVAHRLKNINIPALTELERLRIDPKFLPPCKTP